MASCPDEVVAVAVLLPSTAPQAGQMLKWSKVRFTARVRIELRLHFGSERDVVLRASPPPGSRPPTSTGTNLHLLRGAFVWVVAEAGPRGIRCVGDTLADAPRADAGGIDARDLTAAHFTRLDTRTQQAWRLTRRLRQLGYEVELRPAA